ncbi:hypothetical protein GCM10010178_71750 [Lentzea flava]|uniref:DUF393 domain-containing protein n=1 Tax=Lentzea flava TaxID=103732 RepID=A0ABQ2V5K4_9PSEU|nr:hypothetical protein GCM10010178_71750 [Lentzea flava]
MGRALDVTAGGAEGTLRTGVATGWFGWVFVRGGLDARLVAARGWRVLVARGVAALLRVERRRGPVALPSSLFSVLTYRIVPHYCRERPCPERPTGELLVTELACAGR